jgi:NADH-quinone oxidoreductase subunit C
MSSSPTTPATRLETLEAALRASLGDSLRSLVVRLGEITVVVDAGSQVATATRLRDDPALRFDTLIDLCGVDYRDYGGGWSGPRFAVVMHLLSVAHNWRVRVRSFCADDEMPVIESVTGVWPAAGWFEREAFDLFGIVFEGHADLRRILTDYGFIGHPFRKDFPVSGHVEMRYDPEQKRVVYQPVTIEPREVVPRVIRDERYGAERPDVGLGGQK